MNPVTGECARLDSTAADAIRIGQRIDRELVESLAEPPVSERHLRDALREALDRAETSSMVAVSGQVAQKVSLGNRELQRRRARRH